MIKTMKEQLPYKPGDGGYNRESGKKTLALVAICIIVIVALSLFSMYLMFQGQRVMIK